MSSCHIDFYRRLGLHVIPYRIQSHQVTLTSIEGLHVIPYRIQSHEATLTSIEG